MWGFDEEQLTNLSNYEVYGENYFGNNWDDRMKLLAFEQQQLAMPTFGQLCALESTELTFGQMLAIENEFSNETFGQTLAFERYRKSTELTFGQLLAIERNLELQEGQMTFGQTLALERNRGSSELTFGQLLANERNMEFQMGKESPLQREFELHPPDHVETQGDLSISHTGADDMLGFQTSHAGADEVCERVILKSKEVVKNEVKTLEESIETPHPELNFCQILDL